ncbi:acyltransferase family protein [Senegalimassilia faecalis]|uniref:acyltransferase family protein n=1 Tax=Senegalimassilia faecalis TaxID=2509433 RepID=UPI00307716FF
MRTASATGTNAHACTHASERAQTPSANRKRDAQPAPKKKSRYIPALDGLRALAVLGVIAYHMGMAWAPGGLLGVTVFFVLSGYLITSLLLIEWDNTGTINLPQFWLRRIKRLFPAIAFVIICVAALTTIFDHSLLTKLREDMWAALCWVTNWWYILRDVSYFDALGAPSPVTHFWSLAIEEQFYVVWPVVLILAHKFGVKRSHMRNATLVLVLASALEMALLFNPDADPSRVYYGTDTRAFSLLIGAWLAFVWPSNQLGANNEVQLDRNVRIALDAVGGIALIGLIAMMGCIEGTSAIMYRGGILLASIITMVIIAVIVHPSSILGKVFSAKPLVWIGLRSYGIYLWHYPLLLLMNPRSNIAGTPWWMYLVELAVMFACAAFSYKFVEDPIRHGSIGTFVSRVRSGEVYLADWLRDHAIPTAAAAAVTLVCVGGLIFVPNTSALEGGDLLKDESAHVAGVPAANDAATAEKAKLDVLMIGDSVSVRAIPNFTETFPYGAIDAAVNRQLTVGEDVYRSYAEQGIVGDIVVFALGTNGQVTDEQLDDLLGEVGTDKHVFFVNTRSPQTWMAETNAALERAADRYDNVQVIDWYSASAPHGDWFDGDGTHLSQDGAQAYIDLVHDAIADLLPEHKPNDEVAKIETPYEQATNAAISAQESAARTLANNLANTLGEQTDQN